MGNSFKKDSCHGDYFYDRCICDYRLQSRYGFGVSDPGCIMNDENTK